MKNLLTYALFIVFAFCLGDLFAWDYGTVFLFLYSSWAFVRIGQLNNKINSVYVHTNKELCAVWEAFTDYIKKR